MWNFRIPLPFLDPPEDDDYVTAGCGHEVYTGETLVWWKNAGGETTSLCPDCFRNTIGQLTIAELAFYLGCDFETVGDSDS